MIDDNPGAVWKKIQCYASLSGRTAGTIVVVTDSGKHFTAGISIAANGNVASILIIYIWGKMHAQMEEATYYQWFQG